MRNFENKALDAARYQQLTGQVCGFIIGIIALFAAVAALFLGHEVVAAIIGATTVASLGAVFVTGRIAKPKGRGI